MNEDTITIKLETPIRVAVKGEYQMADEITLKAPTYNDKKFTRKIKQLCMRAMQYTGFQSIQAFSKEEIEEMQEAQDGKEKKQTPEELESSLYAQIPASNIDYNVFLELFGDFIVKQKRVLVGGIPFTKSLVQELDDSILEKVCFSYIANFIKLSS